MKYKLIYWHLGFWFVGDLTEEQADALKRESDTWVIVNDSHFAMDQSSESGKVIIGDSRDGYINCVCGNSMGFVTWNWKWNVAKEMYWDDNYQPDNAYANYKEYIKAFYQQTRDHGGELRESEIFNMPLKKVKEMWRAKNVRWM